MNTIPIEALRAMDERFGFDNLISLATCVGGTPHVRTVNGYYEGSAFYVITHAKSGKMQQIAENPVVGVCGEWFTGHATAESLNVIFEEWIDNGHIDQSDTNTIILRLKLTDGVLFDHGTRYDLKF